MRAAETQEEVNRSAVSQKRFLQSQVEESFRALDELDHGITFFTLLAEEASRDTVKLRAHASLAALYIEKGFLGEAEKAILEEALLLYATLMERARSTARPVEYEPRIAEVLLELMGRDPMLRRYEHRRRIDAFCRDALTTFPELEAAERAVLLQLSAVMAEMKEDRNEAIRRYVELFSLDPLGDDAERYWHEVFRLQIAR